MKWITLFPLISSVLALSDKVKQNVRTNFGTDRFVSIHVDEMSDTVRQIFTDHSHDKFGHEKGYHHIRLSEEAVRALEGEGISFEDHTEAFLSGVERNLNSNDFVCEEGTEACAAKPSSEFFNFYHKIETLYQRYENLANANPANTRWETLGTTYEGREQKLLWIGDEEDKPLVWHYCGIHAREWIGPLYCVHLAESLLDSSNEKAQNLLKKFSFVITPIGNPDGYVYTHTDNNFWRKTRKPNEGNSCMGTDPNRNFGYEWGGLGTSGDPCSDIYRGTEPFDQNCTRNIKNFADAHEDRLIHVNDVHSYGEYYLTPWAYDNVLPPVADYEKMVAANQAMFDAIKAYSGLEFKIGPTATTIYEAAGGSMDYFYGVNGIIYSGTYEARGGGETGLQGFQPPTSNIKPSNAELFEGTYAYLEKILEIELCPQNDDTNIFWEGAGGESEMASCEELADYCSVYEVVAERCPIPCKRCFDIDSSLKVSQVPVSIRRDKPSKEKSDFMFGLLSAGIVLVAVTLGAVLAKFYTNRFRQGDAEESDYESYLKHYDL